MKFETLVAASVAALAIGGAASASTISVTAFNIGAWNAATAGAYATQDFESITTIPGELLGPLSTNVGEFDSIVDNGLGSGSTCSTLGTPDCTNLSLSNSTTNGQGNSVPLDGKWSLNSTDTSGIAWTAERDSGGVFGKAIFVLSDAADIGNNVLEISTEAGGFTTTFDSLGSFDNAEKTLFVIGFGSIGVTTADIRIMTMNSSGELAVNDAMALDGAALAPVPLPAAGWMLLAGIGGLVAMKRRRQTA